MKQLLLELGIETETVPIYRQQSCSQPGWQSCLTQASQAYGTVTVLKIPKRANFSDVYTKAVAKVVFDNLSPFIVCRIENL